ncbi:MAG: hypothetical protein J6Y41_02065 [Bacteroidaceae bacterium]|nr:hypothetical protein [Bacteroidaceae bacterium]
MMFILLFSIDWPTYVWVLLGLAPLIVTVISWIIKIKFRKPETVAYGSSGGLFGLIMMFYFMLWVFSVVLNEWIAPWVQTLDIAPELKIIDHIGVNDGKNWYFHAFTLYCFICFFFMNFRELNEEQAKKAKEKGSLVASFGAAAAGSAVAAGSAATSVLGMIWSGIVAAAYPIVSVTATTITYVSTGAAMFFVYLIPMILIGAILAALLKFVLMLLFLLSWLPLYIAIAIKFFTNLRITVMGPTKVAYKPWDD